LKAVHLATETRETRQECSPLNPRAEETQLNLPEQLHVLQRNIGNRAVGQLLQGKLHMGSANDRYEQEANTVAQRVLHMPLATVQPRRAHGDGAGPSNGSDDRQRILQRTTISMGDTRSTAPDMVTAVLRTPGEPLARRTRADMEARFGYDFGAVRVHTDPRAAMAAREINARAYTVGQHIVFGHGNYRPDTLGGKLLLAHELTHAIQQSLSDGAFIQREEDNQGQASGTDRITARTIFPFAEGNRVTLHLLLNDALLGLIGSLDENLAATLRAMVARRATITTATDDLFEATIQAEVATDTRPAGQSLILRLERTDATFALEFLTVDEEGNRLLMQRVPNLRAQRDSGGIRLSGTVGGHNLELSVRPGEERGQVILGAQSPLSLDVLDIRRLENVRAGSVEEQTQVERAVQATQGQRRFSNQRLQIGGGAAWIGDQPITGAVEGAWQFNFIPFRQLGPLLQVPLELQIQYAPSTALLGALNSGIETSLAPLIPLNVRFVTGLAGGFADQETGTERAALFGPTVGVGAGFESGWFRMNLRYEHLFNLLDDSPSADTLFLRLGGQF